MYPTHHTAGIATIIGLLAITLAAVAAYSAGPYDGTWRGQGEARGDCGVLTVNLVVRDNAITGTVSGQHGSPPITSGIIGANGSARVKYAAAQGFEGTIQFSPDQFDGQFMTFCGTRQVIGKKVQP